MIALFAIPQVMNTFLHGADTAGAQDPSGRVRAQLRASAC